MTPETAEAVNTFSKTLALHAYRQMLRIRMFEEQVNELYTRALMPGLAHLYSGEEAIAVGICEALKKKTTSPARIADTVTAWRKAQHQVSCSPSC
ncbi:hypothetical protein [Tunturiibacter gelidiferens]|uniref:hypothetical protein n=1 Tax=Tunturiibacter gelidiferens TaxID=3069689 RepID=UPI003D9ACED4